ncbi:hypothetical protein WN51_13337 [Melipona quadrifasciata]|uniref:PiggyBac transposable element-derived protein domain-containing protein n=1 Tax=Melipona quadrifasciata TaxID=166423 RepID=A0A0M9A4M7_9HYME|nr:hypothetical protein WN51_13337 [Melipona quadrifasciata]
MENEEIYADEISEIEGDSGSFFNDSDTDSHVLMQYKRRNITQIIHDSECYSDEEEPNIEWTKNDPKRNLEVFIGNPGVKVFRNDSQSIMFRCTADINVKKKKWTSTTVSEMKEFLALNILMSQVQKTTIHN